MENLEFLKREMAEFCKRIYSKGWIANHDGNLSVRLEKSRFLITPGAMSKNDISRDQLIIVDEVGKVLEGNLKPFSELEIHLRIYKEREDVKALIHVHAPYSSAFSIKGADILFTRMAEIVVSLGDRLPVVPYSFPGSKELFDNISDFSRRYNVLLLEKHGIFSFGKDLSEAFYRTELAEHYCKIEYLSEMMGNSSYLPENEVIKLLDKRKAAGLEPPMFCEIKNDLYLSGQQAEKSVEKKSLNSDLIELISNEVARRLKKQL